MKKILIGYVTGNQGSGINKYLKNFISKIDTKDYEIDILTRNDINEVKEMLKEFRINKIHVIDRNVHPVRQYNQMKKIIRNNKYDIAYFNVSNCYDSIGMLAAKKCGVKKVISHSHSSSIEGKSILDRMIKVMVNNFMKVIVAYSCNSYLACSEKAARWMYLKKIIKNNNYQVVYNCVDERKYAYNPEIRDKMRSKLNIEDKFVIGHVGRFSYPKNHLFMLDVFKKVLEKRKNAVLMCIGEGELYDKIVEYSKKIGVYEKIIFTGKVNNVQDYLQAMDVFILPSKFEGLPVVAVEAQFSGLPCIVSSNIDRNVILGTNSEMISIDKKDEEKWVTQICKFDKRENVLNENAEKYKLSYFEMQNKVILDEKDVIQKNKKTTVNLLLKVVLLIHFLLNLTTYLNGFNYLVIPLFILMCCVVGRDLKNCKSFVKNKVYSILVLYIVSYLITFIFNTKYNINGSIKVLIWMLIHFFFVNSYLYFTEKKQVQKEIKHVSFWSFSICTLINTINLFFLARKTSIIVTSMDGEKILTGMSTWGRFYGIFYDPNYASVICTVAVLMGFYLLKKYKNKIVKAMIGIGCIIQMLYIFFCESRTGLLALGVGLAVYYLSYYLLGKNKTSILKKIIVLLLFIFIVVLAPKYTVKVYNYFSIHKYNNTEIHNNSNIRNEVKEDSKDLVDIKLNESDDINEEKTLKQDAPEENSKVQEKVEIGRKDNKDDISNRRFDIWKSGLEIFRENYIIGIGFSNIIGKALDVYPTTYIVNNDFSNFAAFHNVFIDVIVSQGLIGALIVLFLIIYIIYRIIKSRKILFEENIEETSLIMSSLFAIICSSFVLSEILYINNACTFAFWLMFGYLNYYISRSKNEK